MENDKSLGSDKKLPGELAIGIVLVVSLIVGGLFWAYNKKISQDLDEATLLNEQAVNNDVINAKKLAAANKDDKTDLCKPHYYQGEEQVHGWVSENNNNEEKGIVIKIKREDISKLPLVEAKANDNGETFTVKLIDPNEKILADLEKASEQDPAIIDIKGYAEICQEPPLVSMEDAMIAFKKS